MKNKYLFSLMFVLIFLSSLSYLSADYLPHKQNTDLEFSITSNNATQCNVTSMDYLDGSIFLNQVMDKNGQTFNSTILSGNFSTLGDYCFNIVCSDSVNIQTGSVCREVTPNGTTDTIGFYFLILILSLGIIVIGYYMQDATVVILGSFGLTFIGLYILFNGIVGIKDTTYTWAIGIIILCLAGYIGLRASQEMLN